MKGTTESGDKLSLRTPSMAEVESVPSVSNLHGSTPQGFKSTTKSSQTAAFGASRKCGYIKGETHTGKMSG